MSYEDQWQGPVKPENIQPASVENPAVEELREAENINEQKNIIEALNKIKEVDIFDEGYLKNLRLVIFSLSRARISVFEKGVVKDAGVEDFSAQDFAEGRKTDFVVIHPKNEFINFNLENLNDKQFLPFLFFNGRLTYEELVVHEVAHNIFDLRYKSKHGDYSECDGLTDVSEEYRKSIFSQIRDMIGEQYPNLELNKFSFSRQQIAEIFAFMSQREYCIRAKENSEAHDDLSTRTEEFLSDPKKVLTDFNKKNGRNCSMDDFYEENHNLSLIVVPLLEEKYPDFKERIKFFNL